MVTATAPAEKAWCSRPPSDWDQERKAMDASLPGATISADQDKLHILIPALGFDLGHMYVVASERSIVVEIHTKITIEHSPVRVKETQDERLTREFRLPVSIREGSTRVQIAADYVEITCERARLPNDRSWSELVRFDTRASLGCV